LRINRLEVENFRAIKAAKLESLENTIVIAGPNGCGKSCLLDAIRLLKSHYGGYQQNEWHSWYGEFQVNLGRFGKDSEQLFQDKNRPLRISADFSLAIEEREFLAKNALQLLQSSEWNARLPSVFIGFGRMPVGAQEMRRFDAEVKQSAEARLENLRKELQRQSLRLEIVIPPGESPRFERCDAMELAFSIYEPQHLGIIDYHGAQRFYQREQLGGINLNIEQEGDRLRQSALYNYGSKYQNVKSEMAATFVRTLLAERSGNGSAPDSSLIETMKELFATFFQGKSFLGPVPTSDGGLSFPVKLADGSTHDIDELSAGEKEVVYGYLRLRNSAPRRSILLLDEPELHLNPRLIQGLPGFYQRHIANELGNQIWLVTHSDAFIRQAVGHSGFTVLHMQPATKSAGANQMQTVSSTEDLDRLTIELVGDLATYRPGARVLIFEGDDSQFDWWMTQKLFPHLPQEVNAIAGGGKSTVRRLLDLLQRSARASSLPVKFNAIVDRDLDDDLGISSEHVLIWDRYHIENYLLEDAFIKASLDALLGNNAPDLAWVGRGLAEAAASTLNALVVHRLTRDVRASVLPAIEVKIAPNEAEVAPTLFRALLAAQDRLRSLSVSSLAEDRLASTEKAVRSELVESLKTGTWRQTFRGRDVLKRFVGQLNGKLSYEVLRNSIVSKMADAQFQPEGMKRVLDKLVDNPSNRPASPVPAAPRSDPKDPTAA